MRRIAPNEELPTGATPYSEDHEGRITAMGTIKKRRDESVPVTMSEENRDFFEIYAHLSTGDYPAGFAERLMTLGLKEWIRTKRVPPESLDMVLQDAFNEVSRTPEYLIARSVIIQRRDERAKRREAKAQRINGSKSSTSSE